MKIALPASRKPSKSYFKSKTFVIALLILQAGTLSAQTQNKPVKANVATAEDKPAAIYINPDGNVGIGTPSPKSKLHVLGGLNLENGVLDLGFNQVGREANAGKIGYSTFDNGALCIVGAGTSGSNRRLTFWNEGGARFNGNTTFSGNVGIGNTQANYTLDVSGNIGFTGTHLIYNSRDAVIDWGDQTGGSLFFRKLPTQGDVTSYSELAYIDNSGNVGIGNTNAYGKLDVSGNIFTSIHAGEVSEHDIAKRGSTRIGMLAGAGADFAGMELETKAYSCGNGGIVKFLTWGCDASSSREVVRINELGRMGIGTNDPAALLHVNGSVQRNLVNFWFMFSTETRRVANSNPHSNPISILSSGGVEALSFYAMSDQRIKKDIKVTNNADDLAKINQLQVTNYHHKDIVQNGSDFKTGFIAQQVETVLPQAITKRKDFIPSIYSLAEKTALSDGVLTVTLKTAHQLTTNDSIKIITETGDIKEGAIKVIDDKSFSFNNWTSGAERVFVYGKKVDDFRAVDYQQIFSLGIGAIQQLSAEVELLKAQNKQLKAQAIQFEDSIQSKMKLMESQLEALSKPSQVSANINKN